MTTMTQQIEYFSAAEPAFQTKNKEKLYIENRMNI